MHHLSRALGGASCTLLAASLWGTTATARTFAPAGAGPLAVGAVRIVGGGLLLLAVALRGGALRRLVANGARARCLIALGAAAVAGYQAAFFAATARTGVAIGAVVTIGAAPVFAGVLSLLTGRRNRPGARWLAATAAAVAGCVMLATSGHTSGTTMAGIALALFASFCYAVYAVTASYLIGNGAGDRAVVGAIFGGAAVLLSPVLFISPMGWVGTGRGLAVAVYLAVLTTTVAYLLYARGLRTTPVTTATTLGLAEPAIAAVLGLTVLGERLGSAGFAGLAVLAAGLAILACPIRGRTSQENEPGGRCAGGRLMSAGAAERAFERVCVHRGRSAAGAGPDAGIQVSCPTVTAVSPRKSRRLPAGIPRRPRGGLPPARPGSGGGPEDPDAAATRLGPERIESWPDGEWVVRAVPGSAAVKTYRCPGCDQEIRPGTAHVVVWPAYTPGLADRRHWHRPCWEGRLQRHARGRASR